MMLCLKNKDRVDGRNPAPVDKWFIPFKDAYVC